MKPNTEDQKNWLAILRNCTIQICCLKFCIQLGCSLQCNLVDKFPYCTNYYEQFTKLAISQIKMDDAMQTNECICCEQDFTVTDPYCMNNMILIA